MLSDAWDVKNGSYVLTVLSDNARGNLIKMSKIVSKHTNMSSVMTLDAAAGELGRRLRKKNLVYFTWAYPTSQ